MEATTSNCNTISIQIPEGAEHGDVLTFVIQGEEMKILVRFGSSPGDVLKLQVSNCSKTNK